MFPFSRVMLTALLSLAFTVPAAAQTTPTATARTWTDATGGYSFEADLIGMTSGVVVLQRTTSAKELVALPTAHLSQADRDFLQSQAAAETVQRKADEPQTWTLRNGLRVVGKVVEYGRRAITIQRKRSKVYVNDVVLENLPEVKRHMLVQLVAHFEKQNFKTEKDLTDWVVGLKGAPRTYQVEGVLMELENGDEFGVPFIFFAPEDLQVLEPGWQRFLATEQAQAEKTQAEQEKEREQLMLRSAAYAYQQNRQVNQQVQQMELALLGAAAGVTDIWEVQLLPRSGAVGYPRIVVVPGRNSSEAARTALQRFPGYAIGGIAKTSR